MQNRLAANASRNAGFSAAVSDRAFIVDQPTFSVLLHHGNRPKRAITHSRPPPSARRMIGTASPG